jgi:hypothetical protein
LLAECNAARTERVRGYPTRFVKGGLSWSDPARLCLVAPGHAAAQASGGPLRTCPSSPTTVRTALTTLRSGRSRSSPEPMPENRERRVAPTPPG